MPKSPYMKKLSAALGDSLVIVPGVAALIRDEAGGILLERRSDNGCWDIPAGAVDPGETPREALIREVQEETGLEIEARAVAGVFGGAAYRHRYEDGQHVEGFVVVFDCVVTGGTLKSEDGEATTFAFVAPEEMPPLMMPYPSALFERERRLALFE